MGYVDVTLDRIATVRPVRIQSEGIPQLAGDSHIVIQYVPGMSGLEGIESVHGRSGELRKPHVIIGVLAHIVELERLADGRSRHRGPFIAALPHDKRVPIQWSVLNQPVGLWARHTWLIYRHPVGASPVAVINNGTAIRDTDTVPFVEAWQRLEGAAERLQKRRGLPAARTSTDGANITP